MNSTVEAEDAKSNLFAKVFPRKFGTHRPFSEGINLDLERRISH
jgi:hypothetical protein